MTADEYRKALAALGWTQIRAADELHISHRQSRRYALGEADIPWLVEKFLKDRLNPSTCATGSGHD